MGFKRGIIQDGGLSRAMRAGDGSTFNPVLKTIAADANDVITVDEIAGGAIMYTGFTVGRNLTTETAANIIAGNPEMDVGDSIHMLVSIIPALAGTFVAGAGVTLAGRTTCPAASSVPVFIVRTGAATVTWTVL